MTQIYFNEEIDLLTISAVNAVADIKKEKVKFLDANSHLVPSK